MRGAEPASYWIRGAGPAVGIDDGGRMKISDAKRVTAAYSGTARKTGPVNRANNREQRHIRDEASFLGIPEQDLTPEVRTAVGTLIEEVDQLRHELEANARRLEELEAMADEDPLVAVLNRRAFERELARSISFARRYDAEASLIFIDLDNFKQINDEYGHGGGDEVLRRIGTLLTESVRQSDIVGRLGGDEFGVVLVQTREKLARTKMRSLLEQIAAMSVEFEGRRITVSASAGTAALGGDSDSADLIARADQEMYRDKAQNG